MEEFIAKMFNELRPQVEAATDWQDFLASCNKVDAMMLEHYGLQSYFETVRNHHQCQYLAKPLIMPKAYKWSDIGTGALNKYGTPRDQLRPEALEAVQSQMIPDMAWSIRTPRS